MFNINYHNSRTTVITYVGIALCGLIAIILLRLPNYEAQSQSVLLSSPTPVILNELREIAFVRGIRVGVTDSSLGNLLFNNTVPVEFDSVTPEVIMKFENIHPCPPEWLIESNLSVKNWVEQKGADNGRPPKYFCYLSTAGDDEWEWEDFDALVDWAAQNDIGVRGHTFLWHLQNPGWLTDNSIILSLYERQRILEEHIATIIMHYCSDKNVYAYDVVNEAIDWDGSIRASPWSPIPDYIDKAFRKSKETLINCNRPDVKLFYNDFGFDYGEDSHTDAIFNYLGGLIVRQNPTPIDGVGFQTHSQWLNYSSPDHDTIGLIQTLNRFSNELGLEISITETDLPIGIVNKPDLYEKQAEWYGERMKACLLATHCTGFTTWGTHDGSSWRNTSTAHYDPLLFYNVNNLIFDPSLNACVTPIPGFTESSTDQIQEKNPSDRISSNEVLATPFFEYCPKPAYGAVYDVLSNGLSKTYLALVFMNSIDENLTSGIDPYPDPESSDNPSEVLYPGPKIIFPNP
jgi:GH35 family endo-1,4-beta-xylanase